MNIVYSVAILLLFLFPFAPTTDSKQNKNKTGVANIVFKSTDGGQTWQDISKGLPENLQQDSIRGNSFFANEKGLFLRVGNELFHSMPNAAAPFWTKEISPGEHNSITPANAGIFAYNYWAVNLKKRNGTSVWSPIFDNSSQPGISSAFETPGGTIYISNLSGLFKTANSGKTWKHVYAGDWVRNMAEQNGVLMATTNMRRLIRSTDNGENWTLMMTDGDVAWDVKQIKGGFAAITAITSGSESSTRRLKTSCDSGKTWQPINAGLQDKIWRTWNNDRLRVQSSNTSIMQVGENFLCTHRDGIFRSLDNGRTWKLVLPSAERKGLNLSVSGNVIYAIIPGKGGC